MNETHDGFLLRNKTLKVETLIELHVPDFDKTREFYEKLGFEVVRDKTFNDNYLVMEFGENILCFWGGDEETGKHGYFKSFPKGTKRGYGLEIVLMVEDIDDYYLSVKDFAEVVGELKMRPWGVKDFRIID